MLIITSDSEPKDKVSKYAYYNGQTVNIIQQKLLLNYINCMSGSKRNICSTVIYDE